MPTVEPFRQEYILDISKARASLRMMDQDLQGVSRRSQGAFDNIDKGSDHAGKSVGRLQGVMDRFKGFILTVFIAALARGAKSLFDLGTSAEETENKFSTVFGSARTQVQEYIEANRVLLGMSRRVAQDYTSAAGSIVRQNGESAQSTADFAEQVIGLTGDFQSFFNATSEDAFRAIRSGLTGESEPLKQYNVFLKEAEVSARALARANRDGRSEASELDRIYSRMNIILEQSQLAQGDLARTSDSLTNRTRSLRAEISQFMEDLSRGLVPAWEMVIGKTKELFDLWKGQGSDVIGNISRLMIKLVENSVNVVHSFGDMVASVMSLAAAFNLMSNQNGLGIGFIFQQIAREVENATSMVESFTLGMLRSYAAALQLEQLGRNAARAIGLGFLFDEDDSDIQDDLRRIAEERDKIRQQSIDRIIAREKARRESEEQQRELEALLERIRTGNLNPDFQVPDFEAPEPDDFETEKERDKKKRALIQAMRKQFADRELNADFPFEIVEDRITEFEAKIARLRIELQKGEIDSDKFWQSVLAATQEAGTDFDKLRATFQPLIDANPEFAKAFEQAMSVLKSTGKEATDELKKDYTETINTLSEMTGLLDEVANLMEVAFGESGRLVAETVRNIGSVTNALEQMMRVRQAISEGDLTGSAATIATVTSAVGVASAFLSVGGALIAQHRESQERMRLLKLALEDNARAIREQAAAAFLGGRVGADTVGADRAQSLIQELLAGVDRGRRTQIYEELSGLGIPGLSEVQRFQEQLFDFFSNIFPQFSDEMIMGLVDKILFSENEEGFIGDLINQYRDQLGFLGDEFESFTDFLRELNNRIGQYTDDLAGALEFLRDQSDFFGMEGEDALDNFIQYLISNAGDVSKEIKSALAEIEGLDLTTEAGRDRAREIVQALVAMMAAGELDLGGLSPDRARELFERIFGLIDDAERAMEGQGLSTRGPGDRIKPGSEFEEESQSVRFIRTITTLEANRLIELAIEQNFKLDSMVNLLASVDSRLLDFALGEIDSTVQVQQLGVLRNIDSTLMKMLERSATTSTDPFELMEREAYSVNRRTGLY